MRVPINIKLIVSVNFVILSFFFFVNNGKAQNTDYTPLYTSSNFVKTIDLSKPVGTVNGASGTTLSGGVTYSIPVYTPPGTNGVEPSVSIMYNSQANNGIAGLEAELKQEEETLPEVSTAHTMEEKVKNRNGRAGQVYEYVIGASATKMTELHLVKP